MLPDSAPPDGTVEPSRKRSMFDVSDQRRLASLKQCACELGQRLSVESESLRAVCQPARVWEVSTARRRVVEQSAVLTFVVAVGPTRLVFVSRRSEPGTHFVIELLDQRARSIARFLVSKESVTSGSRGVYVIHGRIVSALSGEPASLTLECSPSGPIDIEPLGEVEPAGTTGSP